MTGAGEALVIWSHSNCGKSLVGSRRRWRRSVPIGARSVTVVLILRLVRQRNSRGQRHRR